MNMDETPSIDPNSYSSTPVSGKPPEAAQPERPSRFWAILFISVIALGLSGFTLILYQRMSTQVQKMNTTAPHQVQPEPHWQSLQTQIQTLTHTQDQLLTQITANQHQIRNIMQEQHYQTQDWEIQKARHYLELAQINAEWTHDTATITALLQYADHIFARLNDPSYQSIRKAIAQDMTTFTQIKPIDTIGILAKLNAINQDLGRLDTRPFPVRPSKPKPSIAPVTWQDNLQASLEQLRGLVVVHHQDEAWIAPLSSDYLAVLRETIRMNLQQAEIAVIEQQQTLYDLALKAALHGICLGYNQDEPKTRTVIQALQALQNTTVAHPLSKLQPYLQILDHLTLPTSQDDLPLKAAS